MTYDATITGGNALAVELYEFVLQGVTTRVTSAAEVQTKGGQTWTPLQGLSRTQFVQNSEPETSGEITLTAPVDFTIAEKFRGTIPSALPSLTIYQTLLNDGAEELVTVWKGTITSCAFKQRHAEMLGVPVTRLFSRQVPRAVYSSLCNHHLYDSLCQVVRNSYRFAGTIGTIDSEGTTFTLTGLGAAATSINSGLGLGLSTEELQQFFNRGIIVAANSPEERRMIVETYIGSNVDVVRVSIPFRNALVGNPVEVFAGCAHDIDICDRKFQNAVNFGGFPFVPGSTKNPFNLQLSTSNAKDAGGAPSGYLGGGSN